MAVRPIITIGNTILRQRAKRVKKFGPELAHLIDDMIETMRVAPGVGLAAPQVGVPERVFVAELPLDEEDPQSGKVYEVVNPEIVRAKPEEEEGVEGCLSIPGYEGDVWRSTQIIVKGQDRHGKEIRIKAFDFLARVFQHEIDHLDGLLFIDR